MANSLYNTFKQSLILDKLFDLDADTIKASLITSVNYSFSAAHDEYSGASRDVPVGAILAESPALGSPTGVNGVFDTADFVWTSVPAGPNSGDRIIQWDDTLTNDRLMAFYDTGVTGLPVVPNGGNINCTVNAAGWWSLMLALIFVLPMFIGAA